MSVRGEFKRLLGDLLAALREADLARETARALEPLIERAQEDLIGAAESALALLPQLDARAFSDTELRRRFEEAHERLDRGVPDHPRAVSAVSERHGAGQIFGRVHVEQRRAVGIHRAQVVALEVARREPGDQLGEGQALRRQVPARRREHALAPVQRAQRVDAVRSARHHRVGLGPGDQREQQVGRDERQVGRHDEHALGARGGERRDQPAQRAARSVAVGRAASRRVGRRIAAHEHDVFA